MAEATPTEARPAPKAPIPTVIWQNPNDEPFSIVGWYRDDLVPWWNNAVDSGAVHLFTVLFLFFAGHLVYYLMADRIASFDNWHRDEFCPYVVDGFKSAYACVLGHPAIYQVPKKIIIRFGRGLIFLMFCLYAALKFLSCILLLLLRVILCGALFCFTWLKILFFASMVPVQVTLYCIWEAIYKFFDLKTRFERAMNNHFGNLPRHRGSMIKEVSGSNESTVPAASSSDADKAIVKTVTKSFTAPKVATKGQVHLLDRPSVRIYTPGKDNCIYPSDSGSSTSNTTLTDFDPCYDKNPHLHMCPSCNAGTLQMMNFCLEKRGHEESLINHHKNQVKFLKQQESNALENLREAGEHRNEALLIKTNMHKELMAKTKELNGKNSEMDEVKMRAEEHIDAQRRSKEQERLDADRRMTEQKQAFEIEIRRLQEEVERTRKEKTAEMEAMQKKHLQDTLKYKKEAAQLSLQLKEAEAKAEMMAILGDAMSDDGTPDTDLSDNEDLMADVVPTGIPNSGFVPGPTTRVMLEPPCEIPLDKDSDSHMMGTFDHDFVGGRDSMEVQWLYQETDRLREENVRL